MASSRRTLRRALTFDVVLLQMTLAGGMLNPAVRTIARRVPRVSGAGHGARRRAL